MIPMEPQGTTGDLKISVQLSSGLAAKIDMYIQTCINTDRLIQFDRFIQFCQTYISKNEDQLKERNICPTPFFTEIKGNYFPDFGKSPLKRR